MIELIIVMLLVVVLSAVALPKTNLLVGNSDKVAIRDARHVISYAQRSALAARRNVYVEVETNQITLCWSNWCSLGGVQISDVKNEAVKAQSNGSNFQSTVSKFSFDAKGIPSFTNQLSVSVDTNVLLVEPETGVPILSE